MFSGAVLAPPASVRAEQPAMPVIGVLHGVAAAQWTDRMIGFARGLAESGFVDGPQDNHRTSLGGGPV